MYQPHDLAGSHSALGPRGLSSTSLSQAHAHDYSYIPAEHVRTLGYISSVTYSNFGTVILISRDLVLACGHCFSRDNGYVIFPQISSSKPYYVEVVYSGSLDFKLLRLREPITTVVPMPLAVSPAGGNGLHMYYDSSSTLRAVQYETIDVGPYATYSVAASIPTAPGQSGAARYSLTSRAVEAIHQGQSQALKINDIIGELRRVRREDLLRGLVIVDPAQERLARSSIVIRPGDVIPEKNAKRLCLDEARAKIDAMDYASLSYEAQSLRKGYVRVDIQCKNKDIHNIQIQLNTERNNNNSTIATVIIPAVLCNLSDPKKYASVLVTFKDAAHEAINETEEGVFNKKQLTSMEKFTNSGAYIGPPSDYYSNAVHNKKNQPWNG